MKQKDCMGLKRKYRKGFSLYLVLTMLFVFVFESVGPLSTALAETRNEEAALSYQDIDFGFTEEELLLPAANAAQALEIEEEGSGQEASLPLIYDPRQSEGRLVSLKDQNPYGCCWAFSALGACEASMIAKGLSDNSIDLSERHLVYHFFNRDGQVSDLLGGTLGDYNRNIGTTHYLDAGGNNLLTMWHLASWCGPVAEEMAPYSGLLANRNADSEGLLGAADSTQFAYASDALHLQNAYAISIGSSYEDVAQREEVKKLLLQYGALTMSYYAEKVSTYDNAEHNCYYYDGPKKYKTNHAVQVVGWDDTFPKEYFREGHRPDGDGAWLIKNSWGAENDSLAQNGYFWLSYYDYSLRDASGYTTKLAYVYDCERADNYDHIYQYDGDAGHRRFGKENESGSYLSRKISAAANVYTVSANDAGEQILRAVGIGVSSVGAAYTVSIYTDVDETDPKSGTLAHTQQGVIPYNGYHTIALEKEISLSAGQRYAVVFAFEEGAYVYASQSFTYSPWGFTAQSKEGQSFAKTSAASGWQDCALSDTTHASLVLRIKAYTDDAKKPKLSEESIKLTEIGQTMLLWGENLQGEDVLWECSDPDVLLVTPSTQQPQESGKQCVLLTALKDGLATVTIVTAQGKKSCSVLVDTKGEDKNLYINKDTGASGSVSEDAPFLTAVRLDSTDVTLQKGQKKLLTAFAYYSDGKEYETEFLWGVEDETVASITQTGMLTALAKGTTVVTVRSGACMAKCTVTVTDDSLGSGEGEKPEIVPAQLLSLTMSLPKASVVSGKKLCLSADPVYSREDATPFMVYWKSSDETVAKVNAYGEVTALKPGAATITVYNGEIKAECQVTVLPKKGKLSIVKCSRNRLKLKLQKQDGVDGYVIYRSTTKSGGYKAWKSLTKHTTGTVYGNALKGNKPYYYKVRAYKVVGGKRKRGAFSEVVSVKPQKVLISKVKDLSKQKVKISWGSVTGATEYVVYRSAKKNTGYQKIAVVDSKDKLVYYDKSVRSGQRYYYKVRGCKRVNGKKIYGFFSDVKSVRIQ